MGGGDVIRQALAASLVDELAIELEHIGVRQSPFATFIDYRVR